MSYTDTVRNEALWAVARHLVKGASYQDALYAVSANVELEEYISNLHEEGTLRQIKSFRNACEKLAAKRSLR